MDDSGPTATATEDEKLLWESLDMGYTKQEDGLLQGLLIH